MEITDGSHDAEINGGAECDDRASSDDDRPLAAIASEKTDAYTNFYNALLNFRNHFLNAHDARYPEFTESSESEAEANGSDDFDDLSKNNMRRDRSDEATRLELASVQTRIDGKTYYTCRVCGKHLSSPHTYVFHTRIHTGERPCVCHICGKQFRAPNGLQRHLAETHERRRRHACRHCERTFANSQNLKQHIRTHTGERPYSCPLCGKRFRQSGSLHAHRKTHVALLPFRCAHCPAAFRLRAGLARHRLRHSGERPHACVVCARAFRTRADLAAHRAAHEPARALACALCRAAFRSRRALRHHARRLHPPPPPPPPPPPTQPPTLMQDDMGNRSYFVLAPLETPHKTENAQIETAVTARRRRHCAACGLGVAAGNLARHVRAAHAQSRPHACARCPAAFSRRDHLKEHERTHADARQYVCDTCGAASRSAAALRMHKQSHGRRVHACLHCDARFRRRAELTAHLSVHTGERAHACRCGKSFRLRAQLTRHQRTHLDPPRYRRCEFCPLVVLSTLYVSHLVGRHADLLFHCDECNSYVARRQFVAHMTFHAHQYDAIGRPPVPKPFSAPPYPLPAPAPSRPDTTTAPADSTTPAVPAPAPAPAAAERHRHRAAPEPEAEAQPVAVAESNPNPVEIIESDSVSDDSDDPVENPVPAQVIRPESNAQVEATEPESEKKPAVRQCPHCPKTYKAPSSYFYHLKYTHGKSREHECGTCGRRFGTRGALRQHASLHEPAAATAPGLQCDQCGKRFRTKAGHYIHAQTHKGDKEKKYACAECGRAFRWRTELKRHVARHEAKRTHACEACGRAFSVRADLLRHARTHQRAPHVCPAAGCGLTFAQARYLRAHEARKHGDDAPGKAQAPRKSA